MKSSEEDPVDRRGQNYKGRSRLSRFFSYISIKRVLLLWLSIAIFQQCYPLYQMRAHEIGTLVLPGAGEISYSLKMPVYGGLTVIFDASGEDGRVVVVEDGVPEDGEVCRTRVPEPEGGFKRYLENSSDPNTQSQWGQFDYARVLCRRYEYYGVVRFEAYDDSTGELLDIKYNPSSLIGSHGISVAQFRDIAKGTLVRVEIIAYESPYLKERRRILNRVLVKPFSHHLPGILP